MEFKHHFDRAVIIGASGGIGGALANAVPAGQVIRLSRSGTGLDLTDEESIARAAEMAGDCDAVIVASGALEIGGHGPEKTITAIDPAAMAAQFATNAIGPALILKHFMRRLPRDRRGLFAVLSARVGSIGDNRLGGWVSYRAAKAAVNQIVHTAAIELSRTHPQAILAAIHPGTVATPLTEKYARNHDRVAPTEAATNILRVLDGLSADDTGGFFDWRGTRVEW